jgi:S1-C subfamily serine protease
MDYYTYDFNPPAPPPPAPREPRLLGKLILSAVMGASLALAALFGFESISGDDAPDAIADPVPAVEAMPAISVMTEEYSPSAVGEAVVPAVVTVEIGRQTSGGVVAQGSGSGVIIDSTGYIVTNDHVAGDADSLRVVLSDGRIYEATLIGTDPVTDLAVLDIDADSLTAVDFGSTDDMAVGDTAIAVGNPLGLKGGPSLTVGVLSAVGREVQTSSTSILYGMLQTDAPITQGSSGGALVDGAGRLIGITTAVGVSEVGIEGIGFATPIEIVRRIVDDILEDGTVAHGLLGINGSTDFAETDDGGTRPIGVVIDAIEPGSAADAAGLQLGDVITSVEGIGVDTMDELISALRRLGAGDLVGLEILRGGVTVEIQGTLGTL